MTAGVVSDVVIDRRIDAVVIGASSGGVEALSMILPALVAASLVSVFVVLHIPRERPSLLAEIFSRKCSLVVCEAVDKDKVLPGTVYFAPPDYHLLIDEGPYIALSADDLVNYSRPSIDVLFESAADVYADRLVGIVLTGSNHDGTAGLRAIHRAGGIAVVQDAASAQSPFMVESALRGTPSARSLPLEKIAEMLRTLNASTPTQTVDNHHG